MSPHPPEPLARSGNHRAAFLNRFLLISIVVVAGAGIVAGYLSKPDADATDAALDTTAEQPFVDTGTPPMPSSEPLTLQADVPIHRFLLSEADSTDTIESPALATDDSGRISLAWATETGPQQRQVMFTSSTDGGQSFSDPRVVVKTGIHTAVSEMRGRTVERRLRTVPRMAANGKQLTLQWVEAGESRDSVILRVADSMDGGLTFSDPVAVHQSLDARPTFTSLYVSDDGTVVCSWLDNRNQVQQPFAAVRLGGATAFEPEVMVYNGPDSKGICPCCPTAAFASGDDVLVAFRGNEAGFRDTWVARLPGGSTTFDAPDSVVSPTWEFAGCPHDGPSICQTSHGLHVTWMDAHTGIERVFVAGLSQDGAPVAIDGDPLLTQGHPQIADHKDELHLVWDQSITIDSNATEHNATTHGESNRRRHFQTASVTVAQDGAGATETSETSGSHAHGHGAPAAAATFGRAICYATSADGGRTFSAPIAVAPVALHFQTRPQIRVSHSGQVVLSWMELSEFGKEVVVMVLPSTTPSTEELVAAHGATDE